MDDRERPRSALHSLDSGCPREEWVRIGMAARSAGLTLDDFTEWSRPASNFLSERDCAQAWASFRDGAVQAGTLFHLALGAGWQDPAKARKSDRSGSRGHRAPPAAPKLASGPEKPASKVLALWDGFQAATDAHPYIVAKRGTADGLRVVPADDRMTVKGEPVAGWLVVPVVTLAGALCTLQMIPPPGVGEKRSLPGATFGDGLFIVGDEVQSTRIFIVEGIGHAWACWRATGCAAVVAFGSGRLSRVANVVRQANPKHRVCIVPDRGYEQKAADIARAVDGEWVELPEDKPANYDANDFAADHGDEALAALLNAPRLPVRRYRLLEARDLMAVPLLRWLVRGVVPASGLACMYGASGSGKSFLALDLGAAVAAGVPWFGCRVTSAPVVYVALEGEAGMRQRVSAWQSHHRRDVPQSLRFVMEPFDLRSGDDVSELVDAVRASGGAGGLLILDTLNRAASGADENSSKDMGELIDAGKTLQARLGGVVMFVHHTGKDQAKGMRGHSSLNAALDAAIEVSRNEGRREWRIAKSKDDSDSAAFPFRLDVVDIGADDYGDRITSCAVERDEGVAEVRRVIPPKSGTQRVVWDVLCEMGRRTPAIRPRDAPERAPFGTPVIPLASLLDEVRDRLTCEPKRRTERAQQAITGLQTRGLLDVGGGYVWAR